jgi:hypothetical protein
MATIPGFPINIVAVAGPASASITWEAPVSDGGSTITGYTIQSTPGSKNETVAGDILTYTMIGLINGTSYTFRVFAENEVGLSETSDTEGLSNAVTPYALPGTPTISAPLLENLKITLSWTAVSVGTPIIGYKLGRSDKQGEEIEIEGDIRTYEITQDLVAGTPITFFVTSTNVIGDCLVPASITVTPISNPDPPPSFVAYVGKIRGTALLYWTPPSPTNGGTPVTGYVLTYNEIVINLATTLSFMVYIKDGVAVEFSLVAKNKIGISDPITASMNGIYDTNPVALTAPGPPLDIIAYVGLPGTVYLHWLPQAPTDGGSPVTGYTLTYNGITVNLGAVLTFFDNVAPEQGITFSLVAKNKTGQSTAVTADIFGGSVTTEPLNPPE